MRFGSIVFISHGCRLPVTVQGFTKVATMNSKYLGGNHYAIIQLILLLRAEREARSESTSIYRRKVSMSGRPAGRPVGVVTLFERLFLWNGMTNSRTVILTRHRLGCFCTHHSLGGSDPTPPAISKTDGRRETDEAAFERSRRDASKPLSKIQN